MLISLQLSKRFAKQKLSHSLWRGALTSLKFKLQLKWVGSKQGGFVMHRKHDLTSKYLCEKFLATVLVAFSKFFQENFIQALSHVFMTGLRSSTERHLLRVLT